MAKVTWSALVDRVQGKLGGSIFKKHQAGQTLRTSQRPRYRNTSRTQLLRGIQSNLAGCWHTLTPAQRELWDKFAALISDPTTGFTAFIRHNTRLLAAQHPDLQPIFAPPPTPDTPPIISDLDITKTGSTQTYITWSAPTSTQHYVQIFFAPRQGFTMKGKEKWQLVTTVCACLGYAYHNYNFEPNTKLTYRARVIDRYGRVTPFTHTIDMPHEFTTYGSEEYDTAVYS